MSRWTRLLDELKEQTDKNGQLKAKVSQLEKEVAEYKERIENCIRNP